MIALTGTPNDLSYMNGYFFLFMKQCGQLHDIGDQDSSILFPPFLKRSSSTWPRMAFQHVHTGSWGRGGMPEKLHKSLMLISHRPELSYMATPNFNGG